MTKGSCPSPEEAAAALARGNREECCELGFLKDNSPSVTEQQREVTQERSCSLFKGRSWVGAAGGWLPPRAPSEATADLTSGSGPTLGKEIGQ